MASASCLSDAATTRLCLNPRCAKKAANRCGKCKVVRFCGRDCQIRLWDSHKAFCKSIAKEPEATVLLVDGLGYLGPENFYTRGVQASLARAGLKVASVDVTESPGLFGQVAHVLTEARRFTSCVIPNLGACPGNEELNEFADEDFRRKLRAWVERGGRLIIHSEGSFNEDMTPVASANWPQMFGKTWEHGGYGRSDQEYRAKSGDDVHWCKWYHNAEGAVTKDIYVKAVSMRSVPAEEVLFGDEDVEGEGVVAFGMFGEGSVSFFGDVNAEEDTLAIMTVIARGSVRDSHKAFYESIAKEPEATVLLVDGLGYLGPDNFYTKGLQESLARAGAKVATVDVTEKPGLFAQVGHVLSEMPRFTSCVILHLGACPENEALEEFGSDKNFRQKLRNWVEQGGRLIIHSEGSLREDMTPVASANWPRLFGKAWEHNGYYRTTHECHAKSGDDVHWCKWYPEAEGAVKTRINVKAVMMKSVPPEEILFGTSSSSVSHSLVPFMTGTPMDEGQTAVAHGSFGEGSVSFFGDVNAEKDTLAIMAVIARGP